MMADISVTEFQLMQLRTSSVILELLSKTMFKFIRFCSSPKIGHFYCFKMFSYFIQKSNQFIRLDDKLFTITWFMLFIL